MNQTSKASALSGVRKATFYMLMFLQVFLVALVLYGIFTGVRGYQVYVGLKVAQRAPSSDLVGVYQPDSELGYVHVAGASGRQVMPIGDDIPLYIDRYGFRVPAAGQQRALENADRPAIMTLGCSYTFGDAVLAEDTYTEKAGHILGRSVVNGGVSGFGLANMLLWAQRRVSEVQPDYLVVQFSPWLVRRAVEEFSLTRVGLASVPYFTDSDHGVALAPLAFPTKLDQVPLDHYRGTESGVLDFVSFWWKVGLPLFSHDDFQLLKFRIGQKLGWQPPPSENFDEIIRMAYSEFGRIAEANNAKLVVIALSNAEEFFVPADIFPPGTIMVNAEHELISRLPEESLEAYQHSYWNWRGDPLQLVDTHPNPVAHGIIAEALAREIMAVDQ